MSELSFANTSDPSYSISLTIFDPLPGVTQQPVDATSILSCFWGYFYHWVVSGLCLCLGQSEFTVGWHIVFEQPGK